MMDSSRSITSFAIFTDFITELLKIDYLRKIALAILLLIAGYIIFRTIKWIFHKNINKFASNTTLQGFFKSIVNMLYILAIVILLLAVVGVQLSAYLPGLIIGIGTALGFASRDNLKTIINGIIIILSRPFITGDLVTIENTYGFVIEINIFHVKIKTLEDKLIIVDNSIIFRNSITKIDTNNDIRQNIIITTDHYCHNIKQTMQILETVTEECPLITRKKYTNIIVSECGYDCTEFTVQVWSKPIDILQVKSTINKHATILLEKEYIKKLEKNN